MILWGVVAAAQTGIPGYIDVNEKRNQKALIARALNLPVGITPALRTGQWNGFGAIFADSTGGNKGIHYWNGSGWVKLVDTTSVTVSAANNGTSLSGTTVQLGQTVGVSNPAILTHGTEIPLDTFSLYIKGNITGAFPAFQNRIQFRMSDLGTHGAEMNWLGGGGINQYITSTVGDQFPSVNYYVDGTLGAFNGVHYTASDKHYDIVDLRPASGLTHADIQINGTGTANWNSDGSTYLGLQGTHRIGINRSLNTIGATLDVKGTFKVTDSSTLFSRIGSTSDSVYTKRSDGTLGAVSQSSITTSLSSLTAATTTNSISNIGQQTWSFNGITTEAGGLQLASTSVTSGSILYILGASNGAASNSQDGLHIDVSGANTNSTQTTNGATIVNHHTGTASTNNALYLSAVNGTTNNALYVAAGNVNVQTSIIDPLLIGSTAADGTLTLEGNNAGAGNTSTNANVIFKSGNTPTQAMDILNNQLVRIGTAPATTSGYGLVVDQPNDGASNIGIKVSANNHSAFLGIGYDKLSSAGVLKIEGNGGISMLGASSVQYFNMGSTGLTTIGGSATATSTMQSAGSISAAYVAKTGNYTLTASDHTVEVTSGTNTQTLPTAVGITGRQYVITNSGSGVVTVGTTSSQTFVNVTATPTTLTLNQFNTVIVESNGANWLRITSL
jgi:hypothetical protein